MTMLTILAIFLPVGFVVAVCAHRYRTLARRLAASQRDGARLGRHVERLEMALKEASPEMFAHVKGRSDMEWQQATSRLKDDELPLFFPLEPAYLPIGAIQRAE